MPFRKASNRRVLYIQPAVAVGGAERQASVVLPRLERFGYEPTAVAGPGHEIFEWFEARGLHRTLHSPLFPSGEPLPPWGWPKLLRDALALADELDALHARAPFDVVMGSLGYGWGLAGLLGIRWDVPSVWRAGGLSFGSTDDKTSTEAQAVRLLAPLLAPSALVCNARAVADWWAPLLSLPSYVVPNGVELPATPLARRRHVGEPLVVGFLGRIAPEKNLGLLVDAIALARRSGVDVRGLIAGPGNTLLLHERLARRGLRDSVRVVNRSLDAEELYASVDALALPSRAEGCPNVLLEAMAHGLPVIATQVGGIPEIVDHEETGLLVAEDDAEGFAEALKELALRPAFAARLGRRARRCVADLSPDASARALAAVLDRVTARRPARPHLRPAPAPSPHAAP